MNTAMLKPKQLHLISALLRIFHNFFVLSEDIMYLQACMLSSAVSAALIHWLTFVSLRKDKNRYNRCASGILGGRATGGEGWTICMQHDIPGLQT